MKKLIFIILLANMFAFGFGESSFNDDWTEWNVTYFNYANKDVHGTVFNTLYSKMNTLEKGKSYQGENNLLLRNAKGIEVLYDWSLCLWFDYIKFSLCGAEGLDNLSDDEIKKLNEMGPILTRFALDYFDGKYTNGYDPLDFFFIKGTYLEKTTKKAFECLENMEVHIDIKYYLKNPSKIPSVSRNQKNYTKKINLMPALIIIVILLAIFTLLCKFWTVLMKNEKFASTIGKLNPLFAPIANKFFN